MPNKRCENTFAHSCLTKPDCFEETRLWRAEEWRSSRCLCRACFEHNEMKLGGPQAWSTAKVCDYPPIDPREVRELAKHD